MKEKLFAYSCYALKTTGDEFSIFSGATFAVSEDEAMGKALKFAHREYPSSEWFNHLVSTLEISVDMIERAYKNESMQRL